MAFVAEAEFFTLLYEIKIDCELGEVKKVHNAVSTAFSFIAVRIRNACRSRFVAIFRRAVN